MKVVKVNENVYVFEKTEQQIETEILGQQLVNKELEIFNLKIENEALGRLVTELDLRLLSGGL